MKQALRTLVYVSIMTALCLLAFVLGALWAVPTPEPEPHVSQPAVVYVVVTATPTPVEADPIRPPATPVPPLILTDSLPRATSTRAPTLTATPEPEPTVPPTLNLTPPVQRGGRDAAHA
ncbi:MAG: hypothetical protein AB7P40_00345 [Chloroflexota bacterium]